MSKIIYSYYSDSDAEKVAELMVRNKFWMGKYNQNMTGEEFCDYQKKKGFVFGVLGKQGDTVVSYVAGYLLGSQRVCHAGQIIMSGMIIDHRYRTAVFSIAEMFSLLLIKAVELGYRELIAEVKIDNTPSLYMMKKTGFVFLDNIPTLYGEVVLHNYMPAIVHAVKQTKLIENHVLSQAMQPFKRSKVLQTVEWINERMVETRWKTAWNQYIFWIDIVTSRVAGVRALKNGFQIYQDLSGKRQYSYINQKQSCASEEKLLVNVYRGNHFYRAQCYENLAEKEIVVEVPEEADQVEFVVPEEGRYCFFPAKSEEMRKKERIRMREDDMEMDVASGRLIFKEGRRQIFMEIWPCLCRPYLEGILETNVEKKIHFHLQEGICLTALYRETQFVMYRQYHLFKKNRVEIVTSARIFSGEIRPIFHIGLLDLSFLCCVKLKDGTEMTYCASDREGVFSELIFEDFKADGCSEQIFEKIELRYGAERYVIETEGEAYCVVNFNYIGIRFQDIEKKKDQIYFPKMIISRFEEESR